MTKSAPASPSGKRRRGVLPWWVAGLLVVWLSGCAAGVPRLVPLRSRDLVWPAGTRVMVGLLTEQPLTYRLAPLNPAPVLADGFEAVPAPAIEALSQRAVLAELRARGRADRMLLIRPVTAVLRRYSPYPKLIGFDTRAAPMSGSGRYTLLDARSEPVYETRYRHACRWITYSVECYDGRGRPLGRVGVARSPTPSCPAVTDTDIEHDDRRYLYRWLRSGPRPP